MENYIEKIEVNLFELIKNINNPSILEFGVQNGESTIFEDSIVVALKDCIKSGNLKFSTTPPSNGCSYWIIAISYFPGDKSHYLRVLDIISGIKNSPPTIMIRGTIPVGYLSRTLLPALEKKFNSNKFIRLCRSISGCFWN